MTTITYEYNPVCSCQWCVNRGEQPAETASAGHSWCYEEPHIPPVSVRARFIGSNTANARA
jgi:hypothetical protein